VALPPRPQSADSPVRHGGRGLVMNTNPLDHGLGVYTMSRARVFFAAAADGSLTKNLPR